MTAMHSKSASAYQILTSFVATSSLCSYRENEITIAEIAEIIIEGRYLTGMNTV